MAALAVLALILIGAGGNAAAQSFPAQPLNAQASLIVPDEGNARARIAWDNPQDPGITGHTVS